MASAMPLDADRAEVIHFAGRHRLSPALRDGMPVLLGGGAPGERCGWAAFFAAPARRHVIAAFDPEDPESFRTAPAGGRAARAEAFAGARRFVAALRGRLPPA